MPCGKYYVFTKEMDFEGRTQGVERKCQGLQICPECVKTLTQERDALKEELELKSRRAQYSLCYDEGDYPFNYLDLELADYGHADHQFVLTSDELDGMLKKAKGVAIGTNKVLEEAAELLDKGGMNNMVANIRALKR